MRSDESGCQRTTKIVAVAFVFLYFLYSVHYSFIPLGIPTRYIALSVMLLFSLLFCFKTGVIARSQVSPLLSGLIFLIVCILSYSVGAQDADTHMIKISLLYVVIIFSAPLFVKLLFEKNPPDCLLALGYAGLVNAFLIMLMLAWPDFRYFYISSISESVYNFLGDDAFQSMIVLRMVGITGFSAYTTGFTQVALALTYILYVKLNFGVPRARDYIIVGSILFSALLVSRSSLLGIGLCLIVTGRFFGWTRLLYYCGVGLMLIVTISAFTLSNLPERQSEFFTSWISEPFVAGVNTGSLQKNLDMFVYGIGDFSMLGDSKWFGKYNQYYMETDVGWYRLLFAAGYMGLISWLIMLFFVAGGVSIFQVKGRPIQFVSLILVIYTLVMMLKGAILFDFFAGIGLFMILLWLSKSMKEGLQRNDS